MDRQIFNSGGDRNNATKRQIVQRILSKVKNGEVDYQLHGADPRNYRVDFRKIKTALGFEPNLSIEDGIEELLSIIQQGKYQNASPGNYEVEYPA